MKVKLNVQNNGVNTLKERFEQNSNKELKKVYMLIGNLKESGFDILEEFLIDLKARKFFVIGIDKKNTTRRMLEELCRYTKNVYVYNNNYEQELDASTYIFEYADFARIYVASGSLSESSFTTDYSYYTEIEYDLNNKEDKESYKEFVDYITKQVKNEPFTQIDKEYVARLVETKEIFSTKQYTHNVMSISELLKHKNINKVNTEVVDEEQPKNVVPKIDLNSMSDVDLDIDLGDVDVISEVEDIETESEIKFDELKEKEISEEKLEEFVGTEKLYEEEEIEISDEVIDMESMLFEKANIAISKPKAKAKKSEEKEDGIKSKKLDLEKISNLLIELPAKAVKGKDINQIRIPNYIKDMIENFFVGLNETKTTTNEDGLNERKYNISVEIIDVNSDTKYKDNEALMLEQQGKTYTAFVSEKLVDIYYEEGDIARIIKLSNNSYHIEIIPKTSEEYNIWKKLCTKSLRGSTRMYGVM